MLNLADTIQDRIKASEDYLETKRVLWTEYESIFLSKLTDQLSDKTKSQVFDNKLGTFILEREYRVMNQLPQGKTIAISKNDEGASKLMRIILDKYVIPNANSQFDFLTKSRLIDRYSNIYGNAFALIDWNVNKNGYVGPDMWLLNIRDVFPQVGAVSIDDSDYIIVRTWKPISFFEGLAKNEGYKNVSSIVEKLKKQTGDKEGLDSKDQSARDIQNPPLTAAKHGGYFEVFSQYEKDRWVDYVPSAHEILRDGKNPHDDNELPVINKYSIPLIDDFMAFGDFERGKSMQYTINSLWNLNLDTQKMAIAPPVVINKDAIASSTSIKYSPAAKWLVRGNVQNVAAPLNLTGQGNQAFQNSYNMVTQALLNMFGTSTTSTPQSTGETFGKTPEALRQQAQRESSRDNADRFYMEQFLTKAMKKMVNLVSKKNTGSVAVRMFKPEIEDIARTYPDVAEMWDEKTGKLTMNKKTFGNILYDYEIVPGSTFMADEAKQVDDLHQFLALYMSANTPQGNIIEQKLQEEGREINFAELITRIFSKSGMQGFDKVLTEKTPNEQGQQILGNDMQKFQQAIQGMVGGVNQIPATPGQQPQDGQPPQQMGQPNMQQPMQPDMGGIGQ